MWQIGPKLKNYSRELLLLAILAYHFLGYFLINQVSLSRTYATLELPLDLQIPFLPSFILIYLSVYISVLLPYFLVKNQKDFQKVVYVYFLGISISFLIFLLFPVKYVLREEVLGSGFLNSLLLWLYATDLPFNCFPSLHVLNPFLAGFLVWTFRRKAGLFILTWAVLIALSTLFIRQHYFLDIVMGIALAVLCYLVFVVFLKRNSYK